jgi:hypothetical protein
MEIKGSHPGTFAISWKERITQRKRNFWNNQDDAVTWGAYGVAILVVRELTGLTVVERSATATGFDWWLGKDDDLFQKKARLEVSGIFNGTSTDISNRVWKKKEQTKQSDATKLTAYICVVEFGAPTSRVERR